MEQVELEDKGDVGSSAGVAQFVLFSTQKEEEEEEGGKEGRREAGWRLTNCPSSCWQHPTPTTLTLITAGALRVPRSPPVASRQQIVLVFSC